MRRYFYVYWVDMYSPTKAGSCVIGMNGDLDLTYALETLRQANKTVCIIQSWQEITSIQATQFWNFSAAVNQSNEPRQPMLRLVHSRPPQNSA